MAKAKKKKPNKPPNITVKLKKQMSFDEVMQRLVRVKPPKEDKNEIN